MTLPSSLATGPTRRSVLLGLLAASGFVLGASCSAGTATGVLKGLSLDPAILALAARAHDAEYGEVSTSELADQISAGLDQSSPEAFKAALATRIREDLETDAVLWVEGWVVARTEVRIWTYLHRTQGSGCG